MISLETFKKKLGPLADNYNEEELIKMKNDMDGLANFLLDEYIDKLKENNKT